MTFTQSQLPPLKKRIYPAYGIASIGKVAVELLLQLYLFDFYTRILGLSPILAGAAFAAAILWDAISDVIVAIGLFKARAHQIRYTSTMFVGIILLSFTIGIIFTPFNTSSQSYLFFHLLVAYVLVNTGMTLLDLPQSSLSAELSDKASERNKLLAARMGFGILGLCIGSVIPGLFLGGAEDPSNALIRESRTQAAWWMSGIVLFCGGFSVLGLRRREALTEPKYPHSIPTIRETKILFRESAFTHLLIAGVVSAIGRTINAALALFYYRYVLNLNELQVTQIIFPVFTLSIILSIPLWIWLAKCFGKKSPAYLAVSGLGLMGIIAYPTLPEGQLGPVLAISILGGLLCGPVFLVDSMIADLIDHDEANTGKRKESLYFAIWKSGLKIARAVAFVVIGIGLQISDLDTGKDEVSKSVEIAIVLLFGVFVGLCFIAGGWFIKKADIPQPVSY